MHICIRNDDEKSYGFRKYKRLAAAQPFLSVNIIYGIRTVYIIITVILQKDIFQ
jgi:hypothetical protein